MLLCHIAFYKSILIFLLPWGAKYKDICSLILSQNGCFASLCLQRACGHCWIKWLLLYRAVMSSSLICSKVMSSHHKLPVWALLQGTQGLLFLMLWSANPPLPCPFWATHITSWRGEKKGLIRIQVPRPEGSSCSSVSCPSYSSQPQGPNVLAAPKLTGHLLRMDTGLLASKQRAKVGTHHQGQSSYFLGKKKKLKEISQKINQTSEN